MPSKPTHFVGIDPGHSGGIGMINASGTTAEAWPMPVTEYKTKPSMDLQGLYILLRRLKRLPQVVVALEWPNTWPGQFGDVVRHAEVFGRGKGTLDAFLYLMGFDYTHVLPNIWKAKLGLPGKTDDAKSVQAARMWEETYPSLAGVIRGPRGGLQDGLLDSLLIAHWLRVGDQGGVGWKTGRRPPVYRGAHDSEDW